MGSEVDEVDTVLRNIVNHRPAGIAGAKYGRAQTEKRFRLKSCAEGATADGGRKGNVGIAVILRSDEWVWQCARAKSASLSKDELGVVGVEWDRRIRKQMRCAHPEIEGCARPPATHTIARRGP
jgi:hypothetical protein